MREILYKAKRMDNGEWVEGYIFDDGNVNPEHYFVGTLCISRYKGKADDEWNIDGECIYEVQPDTVCQYTGLTDKNGQKIWENDIIKEYNSNGIEWSLSQIVFADYSLNLGWCSKGIKSLNEFDKRVFDVGFGKNDACKCVVIGNIFDNAELLKNK